MIVRSPVPRYYDYTDAENRERARAKDKTKKEKKGDEVHCEKKKKNFEKFKAVMKKWQMLAARAQLFERRLSLTLG